MRRTLFGAQTCENPLVVSNSGTNSYGNNGRNSAALTTTSYGGRPGERESEREGYHSCDRRLG